MMLYALHHDEKECLLLIEPWGEVNKIKECHYEIEKDIYYWNDKICVSPDRALLMKYGRELKKEWLRYLEMTKIKLKNLDVKIWM